MRRYIRIIGVVFICSTLALAYFGFLLIDRFNHAVEYSDEVNHTYEIINRLEQLESFAKDAETAQRGYIITNDSNYLKPFFDIQHKIFPLSDTIIEMVKVRRQKERIIMLKANLSILMVHINNNLLLTTANNKSSLKKDMDDAKLLMDGLRAELTTVKNIELNLYRPGTMQRRTI